MKSISYSAAKKEALLVFEKFVSMDEDLNDGYPVNNIKRQGEETIKWNRDNKSLLKKFRNSFKRPKLFRNKKPDKENHEDTDLSPTLTNIASNKQHLIKGRTSGNSANGNFGPSTREESLPQFWIIKPPPPPPPPRYFEKIYDDDDDFESDGGLPSGEPSGHSFSANCLNIHARTIPHESPEFFDILDQGIQLVDNEDEFDDIDGSGDKFEDASPEEQERRLEEINKIMNEIVEKEFGYTYESSGLSRSSSSSSIADLGRSLVLDLSYNSFKTQLSSFIRSHNDQLLNQISILFSVARSAMRKVGRNSEMGRELKNNMLRYYDEQFVPLVSKVGGLDGLLKET